MENIYRLIGSLILVVVVYLGSSVAREFSGVVLLFMLLLALWSLFEVILFLKNKSYFSVLPAIVLGLYISLTGILIGILGVLDSMYDFGAEGGILGAIFYTWFFVSIFLIPVIGIWTLIQGIRLIRRGDKSKGNFLLVVGIIVSVPTGIFLIGLLTSVLNALINGPGIEGSIG